LQLLCDVGGTYEEDKLRFDHHQRSFNTVWEKPAKQNAVKEEPKAEAEVEAGIKLSSAGLIFKHFGKEAIYNATFQVWGSKLTDD